MNQQYLIVNCIFTLLNNNIMSTVEIKQELRRYIEIGDSKFLDVLYKTAKSYIEQKQMDRMIAEGEEDIKAGRVHSQDEVQKMIEDWTKK